MTKNNFSRRDFLKYSGNILLGGLVTTLAGFEYSAIESEWIEIERINLILPRLPLEFNGYRLVQISDIHFDGWMTPEKFSRTIDLINNLKPDMIAITGDIISIDQKSFDEEIIFEFKRLETKDSSVGILGNHDHWVNADFVRNIYTESGILNICNSVHTLQRNGALLHICGLDDYWERHSRLDLVVDSFPENDCAILLVHEPDYADISGETKRFDLQISGHSHGGQVIIPFVGPPILPSYAVKYPLGLYQIKNMFLYTNRGIGMVTPRVRFNCRPEITVFTLISPETYK